MDVKAQFLSLLTAASFHTAAPWKGCSPVQKAERGTHLGNMKPDSPDGR